MLWGLLFIIFIIIELVTINLVTIWFAFGSLVALFTSFYVENWVVLTTVFIISSVVSLLLTKPFLDKFKIINFIPTNSDRYIGKVGVVTKDITPRDNGEVKVLGSIWTACSSKSFKVGDEVVVSSIDGVKLKVTEKED